MRRPYPLMIAIGGVGLIVAAAFLVSVPLGLTVAGIGLVLIGITLAGRPPS